MSVPSFGVTLNFVRDGNRAQRNARAKISAVTPAQVKGAATTLFGSENSVIAIVGDYAKVKDQLAAYTNITFLDADGKVIPPPQ